MKKSMWTQSTKLPRFNKLIGDKKTDVLIIGGGMCGLLCAYRLKEMGVDYILAEGGEIASGITKNTTAKITSQHGLIYDKLIKGAGKEKAKMYLDANENAIRRFESISKSIDCEFEKRDAVTYSLKDVQRIEREVSAVNSLGLNISFTKKTALPFDVKGAAVFPNQAQFNPFKFIGGIAGDLNIYEHTFIRDINQNTALTDSGKITFKKAIVATHFPFINKHGGYFMKLYQHRSYVSAYKGAPLLDAMYVDEDSKGMSFRSSGEYLLIGGGGHRTGKKGAAWAEIEEFKKTHYPDTTLKYQWATQDTMSLDSVAYIGKYSKSTPNLYVASGFNKWGMTSSMVSSLILCDAVMGKKNQYAEVFSPQRSALKPKLFINGIESVFNLITPTPKRCPHLGCALKWNKLEHSWDCPCHGSRFKEDGTLIDNPATNDANI